jgi:hypothetical protein
MSKQTTAVEWLISELSQLHTQYIKGIFDEPQTMKRKAEIIEQAKEMEKEQIKEAFVAGDERGTGEIPFNCEQYYQQTFK